MLYYNVRLHKASYFHFLPNIGNIILPIYCRYIADNRYFIGLYWFVLVPGLLGKTLPYLTHRLLLFP